MRKTPTILLVDLEEMYRDSFHALALRADATLAEVTSDLTIEEGARSEPALCVVGMRRGERECQERLVELRRVLPYVPVVVVARHAEAEVGLNLARLGAERVIGPRNSPLEIADIALGSLRLPADSTAEGDDFGTSPPMRALRRSAEVIAATDCTVLLTGETGTGKGRMARFIHRKSKRASHPLVHVDCATLSPTIAESELFGHEKGAFTGAANRHPGRFELARGGTIFLDEIGNLTLDLQAKLLRILQDREYERIGGTQTLRMTARVIAATNRDLRLAIQEGSFRPDLFYRLNVFQLRMPALREHIADIPAIARAGIRSISERLGVPVPAISDACLERLMAFGWPGNVRELLNVLERLVACPPLGGLNPEAVDPLLHEEPFWATEIQQMPLPHEIVRPQRWNANGSFVSERDHLASVLVSSGGNVARAARRLGIPRSTLRYRIRTNDLASMIPAD